LSSFRSVVFLRQKGDKMTKSSKRWQIRSLIRGLCLSSFRPNFVVLSTFQFVVLSFCRLFRAKRRWLLFYCLVLFLPPYNEKKINCRLAQISHHMNQNFSVLQMR
jgi:hypothetical protein